jgi:hypothetical protein
MGPANLLVVGPVFGIAGAISAAGTLMLARRAEKRELLAAHGEGEDAR